MTPDFTMAEAFLAALDPSGIFTFQTFDDQPGKKAPALARVLHGTFAQHRGDLAALSEAGAGVFVMVNEGDGIVKPNENSCRKNTNIIRVRMLFVDLDGAPLSPITDASPSPDIIVESSPGKWHTYWRVVDCPLDQFGPSQTGLAKRFDGDEIVKDLARVMRLPGFPHQKGAAVMTMLRMIDGKKYEAKK